MGAGQDVVCRVLRNFSWLCACENPYLRPKARPKDWAGLAGRRGRFGEGGHTEQAAYPATHLELARSFVGGRRFTQSKSARSCLACSAAASLRLAAFSHRAIAAERQASALLWL